MATIDRVFISTEWETLFPVVQMKTMPGVGSDRTPLVIDTGAIFFREKAIARLYK